MKNTTKTIFSLSFASFMLSKIRAFGQGLIPRSKGAGFILLVLLVALVGMAGEASAAPTITSWSSSGGTTINKDDAQDTMYLVQQGDSITFSITASGATSYKWFVNKMDQNTNSNTFTWTVPSKKGIWVIRVEASDGSGTAPKEWIMSTLSIAEAPDVFDYFVDGKLTSRTETDPWGRPLPEWSMWGSVDYSSLFLKPVSGWDNGITTPYTGKKGTIVWKFRITQPANVDDVNTQFRIGYSEGSTNSFPWMMIWKQRDWGHNYGFVSRVQSERFSDPEKTVETVMYNIFHSVYGANPGIGDWTSYNIGWHEGRFIYDGKELRFFIDNYAMPKGAGVFSDLNGDPFIITQRLMVWLGTGGAEPWIDDVEAYTDKYLFPEKRISFETYTEKYEWSGSQYVADGTRNGIVIRGRNNNGAPVTLADIATAINNPSLFTYNALTKTADSYTNIVVDFGSSLELNGETLNMHSSETQVLEIKIKNVADIKILNSRIDSPSAYPFRWAFDTEWFYNPHSPWSEINDPNLPGPAGYEWPKRDPTTDYQGRVIIENSVINNSGFLYVAEPLGIKIKNCTLNLVQYNSGMGVEDDPDIQLYRTKSGNAHSFGGRFDYPIDEFVLDGLNVTAVNSTQPVTLIFVGGDETIKYKSIKDSNLTNTIISLRKSVDRYGYNEPRRNTLSLVNVKTNNSITLDTDDTRLLRKYYLDVKVIDNSGNPIQGANVTVTNEQDNTNYPAQNLYDGKRWTSWQDEGFLTFNPMTSLALVKGKTLTTTQTTSNGHTPLPTEKLSSLVITDYVQERNYAGSGYIGQNDFTYTITATYNSKTAAITGVYPDETWYRENPDTPTKTVVFNIDTGESWIEGIVTGAIAGTVKDTSNNPIEGATVSDGTRSATTDVTGNYTIANVPAGTYTVTASKTGYQSASESNVVVNQGATTTVDFVLSLALAIDINQDGTIDISDLRLVALHFGETTASPYPRYDVDANGTVDILDLRQVAGGM